MTKNTMFKALETYKKNVLINLQNSLLQNYRVRAEKKQMKEKESERDVLDSHVSD